MLLISSPTRVYIPVSLLVDKDAFLYNSAFCSGFIGLSPPGSRFTVGLVIPCSRFTVGQCTHRPFHC